MKRPHFRAELGTDGALELLIYGDIVDAATISYMEGWGYDTSAFTSAMSVKKALDSAGSYTKVRLRINSPGGDAFEGMAIHSLLCSQGKPVEAYIDGIAASSASIIAMAASTRIMGRSAMMMIHDAWSGCWGNKFDFMKMADTLDKIDESIAAAYVDRTGMTLAAVQKLMDEETWLSAQDCVDQGFATAIVEPPAKEEAKAMAQARRFKALATLKHVPEKFKAAACACECDSCVNAECSECTNKDCDDPNCVDCPMQTGAAARSRTMPALNSAEKKCACDCEGCASGNCKACSKSDCAAVDCGDCSMQAAAAARSLFEARARMIALGIRA